ncbi:uncharacterized protein LOC108604589 isoform X1 [Drosophila busckii]|nr:uncharacterized protein LOC108604589 isoform X1 [Drosophila busckii]
MVSGNLNHIIAPTVPIYSPHSPMHPNSYYHMQQKKLSGRYILNKVDQNDSGNKLFDGEYLRDIKNPFSNRVTGLKISCNKSHKDVVVKESKCFQFAENHTSNKSGRDCMSSEDNAYCEGSNLDRLVTIPTHDALKIISTNDLSENSSLKNSTSLFFKQTIHERTLIALNGNPKLLGPGDHDNQGRRNYTFTYSKSEQTSPNKLDTKKCFNDNNKRSAVFALNSFSLDPWTRNNKLQNKKQTEECKNSDDPWIRRSTNYYAPAGYNEKTKNRHNKAFVCFTKEHVAETSKTSSNSGQQSDSFKHSTPRFHENIASAPPSPHFFITDNDSSTLNHLSKATGLQTKSVSFSPARGKKFKNPFIDVSMEISYAGSRDQSRHFENQNLLSVNNSKMLQNRHSFTSISQQSSDELQLNIRRLSEQIGQISNKLVQYSLSDCNVSNKGNYIHTVNQQIQAVDLHLSQTKGLHARDYKHSKELTKHKENPRETNQKSKYFAASSYQRSDPLLETTC